MGSRIDIRIHMGHQQNGGLSFSFLVRQKENYYYIIRLTHVKPLVPAAFAVVNPLQFKGELMSGRRPVVKIIAESIHNMIKPIDPT
jgi:hypothetical protein